MCETKGSGCSCNGYANDGHKSLQFAMTSLPFGKYGKNGKDRNQNWGKQNDLQNAKVGCRTDSYFKTEYLFISNAQAVEEVM